jgi:outer-membrane receptor for ferric coprogen and ferric-rhodotorulic acid
MKTRERGTIAAAVKAALLASPIITSAQAQESPNSEQPQEIVVQGARYLPDDQTTATGLRLKLIDTPQSISVVSEEMLKQFNAQSAYDAADMIPGLSQGAQAFGDENLLIRGQALNQPRINGINAQAQQFVDSYALERIELVRGPATVLYGITGAFGGELNQILKKPQAGFHTDFGFSSGTFERRRFQADVTGSVPGTDDRLKFRVLGTYSNAGIPQETAVPANNVDKLFSAAATFDFTPNTTASVYWLSEDRHFDPTDGCPMAQDANKTLYIPKSIDVEHWYCNDSHNAYGSWLIDFFDATLSHKFANDWSVNATVAHTTKVRTSDYVFGFGPAGNFGLADTDVYLYAYADREDQNVWTSNLSLGGNFDMFERTQQFLVALEYQRQYYARNHYTTVGLGVMNMFQDGGKDLLSDGSPIPPVPAPVYVGQRLGDLKAYRASFQLLLSPINRLDILAGALVQRTDELVENVQVAAPTVSSSLNETDVVSRFAVSYRLVTHPGQWLTDAKTYFNYSEGFQPNVGVFDAAGTPLTDPQREKSYEVGLKTQWLNGNLDASLAAYHSYVTNVPRANWNGVGTTGGFFSSVLGGKNTYDGVDFEIVGQLTRGWNIELNYAYIKALTESILLNRKLPVASVPKQQFGLLTSYEFLAGPLRGLNVGASVVVRSDIPLVDNDSFYFSGGYDPNNQLFFDFTKVDFRASYKFAGALEGLELYGNVYNAFNARSWYSLSQTPAFSNTVGRPRIFTAGIRYGFGH